MHNGIKEKGIKPLDINDYPAIKNHLDGFYPYLKKRLDKGDTPYNLRNCAYMEDFSKQKLLWAETMRIHKNPKDKFPRFGFDAKGEFFTDKTCFFATGANLKFVMIALNSTMGRYLCNKYVSILDDGGYLMQKLYLEQIPIPKSIENVLLKYDVYLSVLDHLEKIENEIDEIIFASYQLSFEEITYIKRLMRI
jgi:hypothetical protein